MNIFHVSHNYVSGTTVLEMIIKPIKGKFTDTLSFSLSIPLYLSLSLSEVLSVV